MKTCLLFIFSLTSFAQLSTNSYYPIEFYEYGLDQSLDSVANGTLSKKEALDFVQYIMSNPHVRTPGQLDYVVKTCSGESNCFRYNILDYSQGTRPLIMGPLHFHEYVNNSNSKFLVKSVYCERMYEVTMLSDGRYIIPDHTEYNVEHTMPKYHFNRSRDMRQQKTDLHNLYPTVSKVNGTRGHFDFGEVFGENREIRGCEISKFLKNGERSIFEPPLSHKGNVARTVTYFSTHYGIPLSNKEKEIFSRWNQLDPVDAAEMTRNNEIESIQFNRNPFVDFPHLLDLTL